MDFKKKRTWASFIDEIIIAVIATIVTVRLPDVKIPGTEHTLSSIVGISIIIVLSLFKDLVFRDASIGKKIMKLKVVSSPDGSKPGIGQLVLRNLTYLMLFYVEFYLIWFKEQRRLGDLWAKTDVYMCDVGSENRKD